LRLTCVVDNNTGTADPSRSMNKVRGNLLSEHGLSLLIETDQGRRVLLDTASTERTFRNNLDCLGLRPGDLDAVFISHGHYDHLGALPFLLREGVPCHTHPLTFQAKRYSDASGPRRYIGASPELLSLLEEHPPICDSAPRELVPGVSTTGEIMRTTSFEVPSSFVIDRGGVDFPDLIQEEQAIYVSTKKGPLLLTGCGHAGIVNIVSQVRQLTGQDICLVAGGFHLGGTSPDRLARTISGLKGLGVENIAPMHCTGFQATKAFADNFSGFKLMGSGCYIDI